MKIKPEQIGRLVEQLMKTYRAKDLMIAKTREDEIRGAITEIVARNFREEEEIEEEARKMLASHAGQMKEIKEMDSYKMFLLIKQKLAQKRGFTL